jgi:hypothetical protein
VLNPFAVLEHATGVACRGPVCSFSVTAAGKLLSSLGVSYSTVGWAPPTTASIQVTVEKGLVVGERLTVVQASRPVGSTNIATHISFGYSRIGSAPSVARPAGAPDAIVPGTGPTTTTVPEATAPTLWLAHALAGLDGDLLSISCPSVTGCTAVGSLQSGHGATRGLIATMVAGRWKAERVGTVARDGGLSSVSCPAIGSCVAVGSSEGQPYSLVMADGKWTAVAVPLLPRGLIDGSLGGVSCTSPTSCVAVGSALETVRPAGTGINFNSNESGLAYMFNGSRWAAEELPLGQASYRLNAVSCTPVRRRSSCTAVGVVLAGGEALPLVLNSTGPSWARVPLPEAQSGNLASVSCARGGCRAVGDIPDNSISPLVMVEYDGRWSTAPAPPANKVNYLFSVSCAGTVSWCAVAGSRFTRGYNTAGVVQLWDGAWQVERVATPGSSALHAVACIRTATPQPECAAVGSTGVPDSSATTPVILEEGPAAR